MPFYRYFTLFLFLPCITYAQGVYTQGQYQFTAYEKIPAWACVASGWETQNPAIHLYDYEKYKGHANFVSFGLKTGITFAQFKEQVKHYSSRKYLPFFLYDLRKNPFKKNNQSYTWVIRLEDYAYDDNPVQMTETVIKLYKAVEAYISKETGKPTRGLLVLAVSEKVLPNMGIKKSLENSGTETILLKDLINHAGASKTIVLNAGHAVGTLLYVKADENENLRLDPRDIVIFEKTPLRIPPVAGIFTLEPQTPLSHVNLLAKNRETFNVYTDNLANIPNLQKCIGKHVKVSCTRKEILITEISQKEFEKYSHEQYELPLVIPEVLFGFSSLVDLNKTGDSVSVNCVGAKAANFSMLHKNFPSYTGKGFAIPFGCYIDLVSTCNCKPLIDSLCFFYKNIKPELCENMLQRLRQKIMLAQLDTVLLGEILEVQKKYFDGKKIRLRSSTNCEDLPHFNGAGLYLSNGFSRKEGRKKLEEKIKEVYASMWTIYAFKERNFYSIDHSRAAMAILITEAYENENANGVVLTIPFGNTVSVYINSQPGDHMVTNPKGGEIPEAILFKVDTDKTYETRSRSSISDVFLMEENAPLLAELKEVSMSIHRLLAKGKADAGTDIEFKIVKECGEKKLIVKQARLICDTNPY